MKKIKLGQITAPVGIKGEIRVYPYLDQARISDIKKICIEDAAPVRLEKSRTDNKGLMVVKLEGVNDRNTAETLRGKILFLPEGEDFDLGADTYFIDDLVGCAVINSDGSRVGTLKSIISRSVQDLYEIEKEDGKTFLLPAVKEFVVSVDTAEKRISVNLPEGITEL